MPSRSARRRGRHLITLPLALAALLGAGLTSASAEPGPASSPATSRTLGARAAALTQTLTWKQCISENDEPGLPASYYRLQCATMIVPMDWYDPKNLTTLQISVTRLPATVQPAQGVLFTNPGGPGAAGTDLPLMFVSAGRKALMRTQDIYGMDVRGSGDSTNVTCGGPVSPYLDPRNRDGGNTDLELDVAAFTARACDVAGGAVIDHVDTAQTVRDIDLLRTLAGAEQINWLGYSAGTWLGAQYATAYPAHVGHLVFDSNTDFTSDWKTSFGLQPMGFERRFREDFAPWAAKYDSSFGLGDTAEEVRQTYESVRAASGPSAPVASAVSIDQMIASTMYDSALFPIAAQVLSDLNSYLKAQQSGNARAMEKAWDGIRAAGPLLQRGPSAYQPMSSDSSDAAFLAVTCNDRPWNQTREQLAADSARLGELYPLTGWSTIYSPCAFWRRPAEPELPKVTGAGLPPVLMVQSEHDPATPMEGAQDALAHFSAGHLLTVTGSGDHGLYGGLNGCVNRAVEAFIVNGTLPTATSCPGRALPDPYGGLSMASARAAAVGAAASSNQPSASAERTGLPAKGTNPLTALNLIRARLN